VIIYDGSGRPHLVPLPTSPTTTEDSRIHKDSFPKFDGSYDKFPSWLTQVDATLESSRWKNILQDISTTPQNATRSQALRVALLNCLTKDPLHLFQNDPTYQGKGIEMRQRLITKYQPTDVEALFDILTQFFQFKQSSSEFTASFASRMRILSSRAKIAGQVITPTLQVLFTLLGLDPSRFSELLRTFEKWYKHFFRR